MKPDVHEVQRSTGQAFVAALWRCSKAVWRSFRQLPGRWQAAFAVLLLMLSFGTGPEDDGRLTLGEPTSTVVETAADDQDAADAEAIEELESEVSALREQLAMAEARADRAESSKQDPGVAAKQVSAQRNRIRTLSAQNDSLRNRLQKARGNVAQARSNVTRARANAAKARENADGLRSELAVVSAAASAPAAAAAVEEAVDSGCHPSYSGCVPIASDVDCEGGSGNGPEYTGYVEVIGPDEYDLDADGDGVGCQS